MHFLEIWIGAAEILRWLFDMCKLLLMTYSLCKKTRSIMPNSRAGKSNIFSVVFINHWTLVG